MFEDEVTTLILPSFLPESWSATVVVVSSSSKSAKLKMDAIQDLIVTKDIHRKELGELSGSALAHKAEEEANRRVRSEKKR